ncbi:MAG TPA: energy transducer TonB [Chitinophagales bacterium]|nr:energy transducer TonB [Chitinophagales bacterium]
MDLLSAGTLGDTEAYDLHIAHCGTHTTLLLDSSRVPTFDSSYVYKLTVVGSSYMKRHNYTLRTAAGNFVEQYTVREGTSTALPKRDTIRYGAMMFAERMPEFPGGDPGLMDFLANSIRYPQEARENGIEGTVVAQFIVNADGSVSDIRILRDIGGDTAQEVIRVISAMPRWKPGSLDGMNVPIYFNLPVTFELSVGTRDPFGKTTHH